MVHSDDPEQIAKSSTDRRGPFKWKPNKLFDDESMALIMDETVQLLDEATPACLQQIARKVSRMIPTQSIREV